MKKRLVIIVTVPISLTTFLKGQASCLASEFDVIIVTSPGPDIDFIRRYEGVPVYCVPFSRSITPLLDLKSALMLAYRLYLLRPDIVQSYTPKAGLVAHLVGALLGVPERVHGIIGLRLMGSRGIKRLLLVAAERLTYLLTTRLICNSIELSRFITATGLAESRVDVIGEGSVNGVDIEYFSDTLSLSEKREIRRAMGLEPTHFVFVFIGRLVRDKGVSEMVQAFRKVAEAIPNVRLVLAGDYEKDLDPLDGATLEAIRVDTRIVSLGFVNDVKRIYLIADALLLPSYREGLPNCLIEAGAMGVPVIASDISGCREVVIEGETGFLVRPRDTEALASAMFKMCTLVSHPLMRATCRASVLRRYDQRKFWGLLMEYYRGISPIAVN